LHTKHWIITAYKTLVITAYKTLGNYCTQNIG